MLMVQYIRVKINNMRHGDGVMTMDGKKIDQEWVMGKKLK